MSQLPKVSCTYGAPMGRRNRYCNWDDVEPRSLRLFRLNIDSGGYDDGGAYWGVGEPIYCATNDESFFATVRARSRYAAAQALEIPYGKLIIPCRPIV